MNGKEREYMELAIREARESKAEDARIHPKVGVAIVTGGPIMRAHRGEKGEGEHAEFTALQRKYPKRSMAGADVYVTLEPCTSRNHPKTSCAQWLIERKVGRVVIGMLDPNPQICGKGIRRLREANIGVDLFPPDLMAQIEELNREFIRQYETVSFRVPNELNRGAGANLINPHYSTDCQRLDDHNFDLRTVLAKNSILIVVGDGLAAMLVDYPVAGMLRDEIERRGGRDSQRTFIIGCKSWINDIVLKGKKYATISIGGDGANALTAKIVEVAEPNGSKWQEPKGCFGAFIVEEEKPRVALWGDTASETRRAVEHYIENTDGLARFLKMC